jgi:predicted metalloendopeptidase
VPAGLLQSPLFDKSFPSSRNYGAMGAVLGHEFTHGFDDVGRRYDMKGKLHNWWSKADVSNFKQRAQCLVDLYTTYTVDGHHLDGQQTLAENIADAGGVKLSHKVGFDPGFRV